MPWKGDTAWTSSGSREQRIRNLRDRVLSAPSSVCIERARIFTEVCRANEDKPVILKRALANGEVLRRMTISIEDGELIVGNQSSRLRAAPLFPEYDVRFLVEEIDEFDKRSGDVFHVRAEDREELLRICAWWKGRTLKDRALSFLPADSRLLYDIGVIRAEGCYTSGDGHIAVDVGMVLDRGLSGVGLQVRQALSRLDLTVARRPRKKDVPRRNPDHAGFRRGIRPAILRPRRGDGPGRTRRAAPRGTPGHRPHLRTRADAPGAELPRGRPVRVVHPAAAPDRIQRALRVLREARPVPRTGSSRPTWRTASSPRKRPASSSRHLWIKTYSINKIRSWAQTRTTAGNPLYQNVTIGGPDPGRQGRGEPPAPAWSSGPSGARACPSRT